MGHPPQSERSAIRSHPAAVVLGVLATAGLAVLPVRAVVDLPDGFTHEVLLGGLFEPTAMAKLPDGRVLITEQRTGAVRLFVSGRLAAENPLRLANVTQNSREAGLLGIAVDPRWPEFPYVYLFYNRIDFRSVLLRATATGDLTDGASERLVLGDTLILFDDLRHNNAHHGARLRFGADGRLFVSVGDHAAACLAQDTTRIHGKILRIAVDRLPPGSGGQVPRAWLDPGDNPLATADSNGRLVWAMGLRNPWSMGTDPVSGRMLIADTGNRHFDEVDDVSPGDNFGWPHRDVLEVMPRGDCPEPPGTAYEAPAVVVPRRTMFLVAFVAGFIRRIPGASGNWRSDHEGDALYGDYFAGYLRRLKWNGATWAHTDSIAGQPDSTSWGTGLFAAVDFLRDADGSLLCLRQFENPNYTGQGTLSRIRYTGIDSITATVATLVRAVATAHAVRLTWDAGDVTSPVELERRVADGPWERRATLLPDGLRRLQYEDRDVGPGGRYAYRLAWHADGQVRRFGEAAVTIPRAPRLAVRDVLQRDAFALASFSVPEPGPVRLEIFDALGRRAHGSDVEVSEAGDQLVRVPGLRLAAGVYVVRVQQRGRSATGRIVIAP